MQTSTSEGLDSSPILRTSISLQSVSTETFNQHAGFGGGCSDRYRERSVFDRDEQFLSCLFLVFLSPVENLAQDTFIQPNF